MALRFSPARGAASISLGSITRIITLSGSGTTPDPDPDPDPDEVIGPFFYIEDYGAVIDDATDDIQAIQDAVDAANDAGGGIVTARSKNPAFIKNGINLTGMSYITIRALNLRLSADFDGRNNTDNNDAIWCLNFDAVSATGHLSKHLTVEDCIIDCTLQNAGAIVVNGEFGRTLAAVEIMNADYTKIRRNHIIKAFGNALVASTADPLLIESHGYNNGTRHPIIEDNVMEDCVRGLLPQYGYGYVTRPAGITGSVIQIGSCHGGRVKNNHVLRPGGPFLDIFNCQGLEVCDNYIYGVGTTPIGSSPFNAEIYQQSVGTIHSDFGLDSCFIERNFFYHTGGIILNGNMTENFFNGNLRTPGPINCRVRDNVMLNPQGRTQVTAPTIGSSPSTHSNPYSQPVAMVIMGGTGVSVQIRRGTDGSFVAATAGTGGSYLMFSGDAVRVTYTTVPTWVWYTAPNALQSGITISGGSVASHPGQCVDNEISSNSIVNAGLFGIACYDASYNHIQNNYIEDPGFFYDPTAISMNTQIDQAGGGCSDNLVSGNIVKETRSPVFLRLNYEEDNTTRHLRNSIINNVWANTQSGTPMVIRGVTSFAGSNRGVRSSNFLGGPPDPAVPASTVSLTNPFNYDAVVYVAGGTVTVIATGPSGSETITGVTSGTIRVRHGEAIKITYSVAPTTFNWFTAT